MSLGTVEAPDRDRRAVEGVVDLVDPGGEHAADHPLLLHGQVAPVAVGDRAQPVGDDLDVLGGGRARGQPVEALGHRGAAQLAGRALAARLVRQEAGHGQGHLDHRRRVVEHPEPGGAHAGPGRLQALVAAGGVEGGRRDERVGHAGQHRLDRAAGGDAPGDPVDDLAQRGPQLDLAHPGAHDVADHGGDDDAGGAVGAERAVPLGAPGHDLGRGGQRLDVVDDRRVGGGVLAGHPAHRRGPAAARHGGEQALDVGGHEPGERGLALDDLEQAGLLAEQVVVGAEDDLDRHVARQPRGGHLLDGGGQALALGAEAGLGADVRGLGADREGGDGGALDHGVGVGPDQRPVLERRRLALGPVAHDERPLGPAAGGGVRHGLPLAPGREPAPAPAPQARQDDLLDRGPRSQGPVPAPGRLRRRGPGGRRGPRPGDRRAARGPSPRSTPAVPDCTP